MLAIGLENGNINIWKGYKEDWQKIFSVPDYLSPCLAIRRIKFNKRLSQNNEYVLGVCGVDHCVRLLKLTIN